MKLAYIVRGQPGDLKHLDKSYLNVENTLKTYTKYDVKSLTLDGVDSLIDFLNDTQTAEAVEEFIFYYVGHGDINYADTNNRFELEITTSYKISIKDIILKIRESIKPKKIFIVIDSCKSGKILEDLHTRDLENVYLLSSSSKYQLSYECNILKSTRFSAYFCDAIKFAKNERSFKYIEQYLVDKFNEVNDKYEGKEQHPKAIDLCSIKSTILVNDVSKTILPKDEEIFLTVELEEVDNSNYKIIIWAESEDGTYEQSESIDDKSYKLDEIAKKVDYFLTNNENYRDIASAKIFLIFVLPARLMKENINSLVLSNGHTFGSKYTVLLRGLERFRDNGQNHLRETYRLKDWKTNWKQYKVKCNSTLEDTKHILDSIDKEDIPSRKLLTTPLIVLGYTPQKETFLNLYKSAVPVALWANSCVDYEKFEELVEDNDAKKLSELHKDLFEMQPAETGLKSSIMMLYDNPYRLPLDEEAPLMQVPQ